MGYFDKVNPGLFSIFSGENKNLYYDVICIIDKKCEGNHMYKKHARKFIAEMMIENREYCYESGKELANKELEDRAGVILNQLKSHGWINESKEMLDDEKIYITKNANILLKAMNKMSEQENKFEFKNAIQSVYSLCKIYKDNEISPNEYYVGFLEAAARNTDELREEMIRFNHEFEDMIKELAKEMDIKELSDYVLGIFNGNRMRNYSRILNDESGYFKYSSYIVRTIKGIKYDEKKVKEMVASYEENTPEETRKPDSEDYIWELLSRIQIFYESEYINLANDMSDTVTTYLRRINNKMKMTFSNVSASEDPSDTLLSLIGESVKHDSGKWVNENINRLFNMWRIKILDIDSLYRNIEKTDTEAVEVKPEEIDPAALEAERILALEEIERSNARNAENTKRYIKETFGEKDNIDASEFAMETEEDYIRLHDIIGHAMSDDFDYEIEIIENKGTGIKGNVRFTPFKVRRKNNEI